jgi:hypothetical protein
MACHPSGICVDIIGINASDQGRSCEKHDICGVVLAPDVVVRIREVQLAREVVDEANPAVATTALAVYHVSGGIDCCRVGFLRRHLLKYKDEYDGRLAQVTEVFGEKSASPSDKAKHHRNKGCARAVLIEAEYRDSPTKDPNKRLRSGSKDF